MAKTHRRTRWPRAIEFCNTVGGKADRALKCRFAADDPKRILRNAQSQERLPRAAMLPAGQQFPPSDGDCHTPLPREVRKGNDTTPRACCLRVQGGWRWAFWQRALALSSCPCARIKHGSMGTPLRKTLAQTGALSVADRAALSHVRERRQDHCSQRRGSCHSAQR